MGKWKWRRAKWSYDGTKEEGGSLVITKLEEVIGTQRDITEEWKQALREKTEMPTSTRDLRSREILRGTYLNL